MKELNEKELRAVCKCANCGKGIMHTGLPLFWVVKVERYGVDGKAIQRQNGLEQMMGGHVALAQVFSPDETMARQIIDKKFSFCEECMTEKNLFLLGLIQESNEDD